MYICIWKPWSLKIHSTRLTLSHDNFTAVLIWIAVDQACSNLTLYHYKPCPGWPHNRELQLKDKFTPPKEFRLLSAYIDCLDDLLLTMNLVSSFMRSC